MELERVGRAVHSAAGFLRQLLLRGTHRQDEAVRLSRGGPIASRAPTTRHLYLFYTILRLSRRLDCTHALGPFSRFCDDDARMCKVVDFRLMLNFIR